MISISNKCCSIEPFNIDNIKKCLISEGSHDIEVWSNGCWKFSFANTGINDILKCINSYNSNINAENCSSFQSCRFGRKKS